MITLLHGRVVIVCVCWGGEGGRRVDVVFVPWAAITKYYRLGGVNNRIFYFSSSISWKSNIKVPSGLLSVKFTLFYTGVERNRSLVSLLSIRTPVMLD